MDLETSRRAVLSGAGAVTASLAGCLDGFGDEGTSSPTDTPVDDETVHAGMVYALGGLGDKSFNDMAYRGVQQAGLEYDVRFDNTEPAGIDDFAPAQENYATSTGPVYDIVCCIGFLQQDALSDVAPEHGDQRFMLVDEVVEADNVANYLFREHQGSFLAGHLAGELTGRSFAAGAGETNAAERTIGFVGGIESTLIEKFEAGYRAGADHADADVEVLAEYVGAFDDVEGGRAAAESMYDDGADIVYHAAGGSGVGVFQAAQDRGRFAIGVDSDQSESNPDYSDVIVASMVKRVDTAVFRAIESVVQGSFPGGETRSLGLERQGVELAYGTDIGDAIPDEVTSGVADSRERIVAGDIDVPEST